MYIWELFGFRREYNFKVSKHYFNEEFKQKADAMLGLGTGEWVSEYGMKKLAYRLPSGLYITFLLSGVDQISANKGGIRIEETVNTKDDLKRQVVQGALSSVTNNWAVLFSYFKPDMRQAMKVLKEIKNKVEAEF